MVVMSVRASEYPHLWKVYPSDLEWGRKIFYYSSVPCFGYKFNFLFFKIALWSKDFKLVLCFLGGSTNRGTDRGIQGGVLTVRQGWRWHHHDQRVGHRDEIPRTEPHRSRASRHDQRSWRRRWVIIQLRWTNAWFTEFKRICRHSSIRLTMLHSTRDPSSTIPLCKLQRIQVKHSSLRIYSNYIPTTFSNGNQIVSLLRGSPVAHRNSLDRNRFIAKTGIITNSITYHGMLFCHY